MWKFNIEDCICFKFALCVIGMCNYLCKEKKKKRIIHSKLSLRISFLNDVVILTY